jgi:hypothetical protein
VVAQEPRLRSQARRHSQRSPLGPKLERLAYAGRFFVGMQSGRLTAAALCSMFVLMEVETLGVARSLGWKVHMRCANGYRQETRSQRKCVYRKQLDLETLGLRLSARQWWHTRSGSLRGSTHLPTYLRRQRSYLGFKRGKLLRLLLPQRVNAVLQLSYLCAKSICSGDRTLQIGDGRLRCLRGSQ